MGWWKGWKRRERGKGGGGWVAPIDTCNTVPRPLRRVNEVRNTSTHLICPVPSIRKLYNISKIDKKAKIGGAELGHMP